MENKNKLVLVTESMTGLARKIETALQKAGFSVAVLDPTALAPQKPEGLPALALILPDLRGAIFTETVSKLRPENSHERIPILALLRPREAVGGLLREGATEILHLPSTDRELLLRIQRALERCDLRKGQMQLIAQLEQQREKLSRYFSPKELQRILASDDSTQIVGQAARGTFLMFDLRDSTGRAERMGAEKFFPFMTELFADLSDLVHGLDGTLSKFTGDGFLAIFGCPDHSREAALNALRCAVRIRAHIDVFNSLLPSGEEVVRFGIGVATGTVFRGNIGNVHRIEYTVLGDAVNLASRLEQMTKQVHRDILVDGETIRSVGEGVEAARLGLMSVRGKEQKIEVYHLQNVLEFCAV